MADAGTEDVQSEEQKLLSFFRTFDANSDGLISRMELEAIFKEVDPVHWNSEKLQSLFEVIDCNNDGMLDYSEFVAWVMQDDDEWRDARLQATLSATDEHIEVVRDRRSVVVCDTHRLVNVHIETDRDSKLGIKLANAQTLVIKSIHPDGLLARWNGQNRKEQISPGDRIVSMNGITEPKAILRELRKIGKMDFVFELPKGGEVFEVALDDVYEREDVILDDGKLACVRRARNIQTNHQVVVKSVHKKTTRPDLVEREISALKTLKHLNIVRLYDVFEDYLEYHLILGYCSGGEVFEKILHLSLFSEKEAAKIQQQILNAVAYMHSKHFAHRDLKPENILLERPVDLEMCVIKIIDFHSARQFGPPSKFFTIVGSPEFSAPEITMKRNGYTSACDLWSCGCLMYFMIAGYPPFCGETAYETAQQAARAAVTFPKEEFDAVSSDAKDLVLSLIQTDVNQRLTAEQAIKHTWIQDYGTKTVHKSLHHEANRMKEYVSQSKFGKHALHLISHHLSSEQIRDLKNSFDLMDANKDGEITFVEFKQGLVENGGMEDSSELIQIFESLDVRGTKRIDFAEFLAATMGKVQFREEAVLWSAFQAMDTDGSGFISKGEIAVLLQDQGIVGKSAAKVLEAVDANGDERIDFSEFVAMLQGTSD